MPTARINHRTLKRGHKPTAGTPRNLRAYLKACDAFGVAEYAEPRLPPASMLGITYKQRLVLVSVRKRYRKLADVVGYFDKTALTEVEAIDRLLQETFPNEYPRVAERKAAANEVEKLFGELATS